MGRKWVPGARGGTIEPWNGAGAKVGTAGELISVEEASSFFCRFVFRPDAASSAGRFFGGAFFAAAACLYSAQNSFLKFPLAKHSRSQSQIAHCVRPRLRSRGTLRKQTVVERT